MMVMWQTPAILIAVLLWLQAPPASLADAARREALRRELMPKAVRSLTNRDVDSVPPRPLPVVALPVPDVSTAKPTAAAPDAAAKGETGKADATGKAGETRDEAWWRTRMTTAVQAQDHDRLLAGALQSRINSLTNDWSARDDPAQRQQLWEERERTIAELKNLQEQLAADQKTIEQIEEDARTEGVPAGWLR